MKGIEVEREGVKEEGRKVYVCVCVCGGGGGESQGFIA